MNLLTHLFCSSLGKKYLMAITGAGLFLFVFGHMVGNLQIFLGSDQINTYAYFLQHNLELLYPVRAGMLALVGLHIWAALSLTLENRAARPVPYAQYQAPGASLASRTLIVSGLIIAAFVIYHLLHFTVKTEAINLTGQSFAGFHDEKGRHDVYRMMILGFSKPAVSLFYMFAIGLLCLHLSHGVSSMFQSLGLKNHAYDRIIDQGAKAVAVVLFGGYCAIPLAVLSGILK